MSTETIPAARGILATCDQWLERLEVQLALVRAEVDAFNRQRGEMAVKQLAHQNALAELSARQVAEHEARKRELAGRESNLAEREHQLANDRQRVEARDRAIESRAADLAQRYRGAA
jgi:uncharacterized protein (DUF3084 family)